MTAPMDAAQIAALDAKLASQIGDDVQRIYDHEALFKESRAALQAQAAELERLRAALTMLLPQNLGPLPERAPDSGIIPVDMTFGEIRQARAALKGGAA